MPAPLSGQGVCAGPSTGVALSATAVSCTAFLMKAPLSNSGPVWIGPASVTSTSGYQMDPGDVEPYERQSQQAGNRYELNPSDLYVAGTAGDKITWLASP